MRYIHTEGATSRARLTEVTGLNRSTIAAIVSSLSACGLVREEPPLIHHKAGRPSPVVHAVSDTAQVIAVDVGVDRISTERVGLGNKVLEHHAVSGADPASFKETVARLCAAIDSLVEEITPSERCVGIGIAVPGLVRSIDGMVRFAPNLAWTDQPLAAALTAGLGHRARGLPIHVANDADLGALAEHTRGAARGYDDFIYISGNIGVGGGLFLGGRPMTGHRGYAGEIGHMIVNPDGRQCRCGARGCWETEIGTNAIIEAAGLDQRLKPAMSAVVEAARSGDHRAARALDNAARWLAVGLGNLANILNPTLVVFGGDLHEVYAATINQVEIYAAESGLARVREVSAHRISAFGMRAPLVGAAELAFAPALDDPLASRTQ